MAKLLQIAQIGHPILRKKAKKVAAVSSPETQNLIDDLIATAKESNGIGIAAPQVYQSLQIFILSSRPNARYPKAHYMKPTAVINPKIVSQSKVKKNDWEGCLSIPAIRGHIPRFTWIKIEYTTRGGKKITKTFKDFIGRIVQHEYDHLQGILFLDRLESNKDIISEKEYQKLVKKTADSKLLG